jgi:hypothetical protein
MAKIPSATVERWRTLARDYMGNLESTPERIWTGREAWVIADRVGISREAYQDRTITDGHIQTALEKIFPNAMFLDRKAY